MRTRFVSTVAVAAILLASAAVADSYTDTIGLFKKSPQSAAFFDKSYGYAVFPTIAKGGFGVGAAHGKGRVYVHGKDVGDASMTQVSVGLQMGGQAFSQIVFFQDESAFREFTSGSFEFAAGMSAVAITAAASGSVGTKSATGSASSEKGNALTAGAYHKGMAVFTIVKGGAMYEVSVGGQKFSYKPRSDM